MPGLSRFLSPENMDHTVGDKLGLIFPHDLQVVTARESPEPIMGLSSSLGTIVHVQDTAVSGNEAQHILI